MITPHIISADATLSQALQRINALPGGMMTLFATDDADNRHIVGSLTDGDIRRALLGGMTLDSRVANAMNRDFRVIDASATDNVDAIRRFRAKGITLIPRVDTDGRIIDILNLNATHTLLPLSAILMAGGIGERLRPLTLTTPKPLLQIEGRAIIDYNIEGLARCGITDITVATRYLAEQIHAHFSQPVAGVKVKCVTETAPLGTIGAVTLVEHPADGSTLVMNSDLLTTISFEDMYLAHRDADADITIAVIPYQVSVPYAILATDGNRVTGIEEKPSYSFYANAGIYIIKNTLLDTIRPGERIDATDFVESAIKDNARVTYYTINGTWIDVGSPTDFRQAAELMRHSRNLSGF